jgi:quercetin dioxygenase-like cupin family protein
MNLSKMPTSLSAVFVGALLVASSNVLGHPGHESPPPQPVERVAQADSVAAAADPHIASIGGLTGPTSTRGIASIETLGVLDLGEEFPAMQGRQMRARVFTIEAGGVIAIHAHEQRPGYALILSGSIVEHRNDQAGPVIRKTGDIAIERAGVVHWWENVSGEEVRALVVDIVGLE